MPTYYDTTRLCFSQKRFLILAQTLVLFVCFQDLLDGLFRWRLITGLHVRLLVQRIYMITLRIRHRYVQTRKDIYVYICKDLRKRERNRKRMRGRVLSCDIESSGENFGYLKIRQRWQQRVATITNSKISRAEKRARTTYIGGLFLESSGRGRGREDG